MGWPSSPVRSGSGSPSRPKPRMKSSLCRVAFSTTTPPTVTGFSRATGVSAPVRPTWMSMASSTVVAFSAGNLWAMAQRGERVRRPRRFCSASESAL